MMATGTAWTAATLCGDRAFEARVHDDVDLVGDAVVRTLGSELRALLLLGGYARGDGGAVARGAVLRADNDYDFVAVVRAPRRVAARLGEVAHLLGRRVGVEVDLWPLAERSLSRLPPTLLWLDASLGGLRLVRGDPAVLDRLRPVRPREVPLDEGARLLANRAAGLALSNLEQHQPERLIRHAHKAVLAAGDVRLLAADRYALRLPDRLATLEALGGAPGIAGPLLAAYRDAVAYRARPDRWRPRGELEGWYASLLPQLARWHFAFERWRVGAPEGPVAYARHRGRLFAGARDVHPLGSVGSALRAALGGRAPLRPWLGHPRERLARVATALAFGRGDPASRSLACTLLGLPATAADPLVHAALRRLVAVGG